MNKLVRDKIVDIIKAEGRDPNFRILSHDEYLVELKKKLQEEAKEVLESSDRKSLTEELADVMEVMSCILEANKITEDELIKIQNDKRNKRGSFKRMHFLMK